MTLYFTLVRAPTAAGWPTLLTIAQVFVLLVTEMAIFVGLIVPLPFTVKRKLFTFISESPIVAKLQYGMKACLHVGVSTASNSKPNQYHR